jgi:putative ABC transport system substrate-binding protein
MRRREFIAGLGGAVAWPFTRPFAAEAQRHVGALLNSSDDPRYQSIVGAFREGLAAVGWGSLGGRWLELFKEAVPRLTRVADIFFVNDFFVNDLSARNELRATIPMAAAQLGVMIIRMPVRNAVEIEPAISPFAVEPNGGLLVGAANPAVIGAIGRLALHHHLPLMCGGVAYARPEGILIAHGPDPLDLARRASSYVDRVLRGAKPGELPIQYPTKFELVVNLKTAKAIGVTIPETFLARADEVIE